MSEPMTGSEPCFVTLKKWQLGTDTWPVAGTELYFFSAAVSSPVLQQCRAIAGTEPGPLLQERDSGDGANAGALTETEPMLETEPLLERRLSQCWNGD